MFQVMMLGEHQHPQSHNDRMENIKCTLRHNLVFWHSAVEVTLYERYGWSWYLCYELSVSYKTHSSSMQSHINAGCWVDVSINELAGIIGKIVSYKGDI
jgi:hypothetical protein